MGELDGRCRMTAPVLMPSLALAGLDGFQDLRLDGLEVE
jgi:hypothetical protein